MHAHAFMLRECAGDRPGPHHHAQAWPVLAADDAGRGEHSCRMTNQADPIVVLSHSRQSLSVCSPVPIRGVRVPRSVEAAVNACGCAPPTSPSAAAFRTETCAGASDTLPLRLLVCRRPGDRHSSAARADKLARSKCTHTQPGAAGHIPCAATAATPVARLCVQLRLSSEDFQ